MQGKSQLKQKWIECNKLFIPFMILIVMTLGLVVYEFVSLQVEISQKNAELAELTAQRAAVESENRQLSRYSEDNYKIEYIEKIARNKLGYALPEERIYYIVPTD